MWSWEPPKPLDSIVTPFYHTHNYRNDMKTTAIIAALCALPLTAQDTPTTPPQQEVITCSCPSAKGTDSDQECPQATMAAAFGFQQGYHMGFETGFVQALQLVQKCGNCGSSCGNKGHKHHKGPRPGMQGDPRAMINVPQPPQQPQPAQPAQQQPAPQD